eukprot:TRINITY_DN33189_c0_g1_i1.p2 TRINITY_DN33189_c0_g1~~TRINITY_DN33189_c0_g1_i1.p2  ORF type:complete len:190 (+),score=33.64 TRINITY_DN33189_c0_g1_i1:67-570(+)
MAAKFAQVLVVRNGRILLGRWRHGDLAGRITGPLGPVSAGVPMAAEAQRICREVAGVECSHRLQLRAVLRFKEEGEAEGTLPADLVEYEYFDDDGSRGANSELSPLHATADMDVAWYPLDRIPYGEMPEDDAVWYPLCLRGRLLRGDFKFAGTRMRSASVHECDTLE